MKGERVTHVSILRVLIPMFLPAIEPDDLPKNNDNKKTPHKSNSDLTCVLLANHLSLGGQLEHFSMP